MESIINFIKKLSRIIIKDELQEFEKQILKQQEYINSIDNSKTEDEVYYENKYPKLDVSYKRIDKISSSNIDVRTFIQPKNYYYPIFKGSDDEIALQSLKWIIDNITYKSDKEIYKETEYWAFPHETIRNKFGDCEDGALLLASILIYNNIKPWKIRLTVGYVQAPGETKPSGHAYVTYYCEETGKWVLLDWCYYQSIREIKDRESYYEIESYKDVWFSFNSENSWGKDSDIRIAQKEIENITIK